MNIKWEDFAKRRTLTLKDFSHMKYKEYATWCSVRGVDPIHSDFFPQTNQKEEEIVGQVSLTNPIVEELVAKSVKLIAYSLKDLSKRKKSTIQTICQEESIEYTAADTKRQLIQRVLQLNKL